MVMPASTVAPWRVAGHSVRGAAHLREDIPNQDAVAHWFAPSGVLPVCAVAAVADGHGGKRHFRSADGSRLAVKVAVRVLRALALRFAEASAEERSRLAAAEVPPQIVAAWVDEVRSHLEGCPITDDEWRTLDAVEGPEGAASVRADPLLAYGATLLAALVTPESIGLWQLGDGDVVAVSPDGTVSRPVAVDERLLGNLTTSICRPGAEADFRSVVLSSPSALPSLLMLSTDGYANSFRTDADFLKVGGDLQDLIAQHGLPAIEARLGGILEDASANGSGDDITVALLHRDGVLAAKAPKSATGVAMPASASASSPPADVAHALAAAQQRIARLRSAVALLLVAILAGLLWWAQDRKPVSSPTLDKPIVLDQPSPGSPRPIGASAPELKPQITVKAPSVAQPLPTASLSEAPKPQPSQEPNQAYLKATEAVRTERGIDVTATVSAGNAPNPTGCGVRVIVLGGQSRVLAEKRADVPEFGDASSVQVKVSVAYPKDADVADMMRLASTLYSVFLDCGGNTVHSLTKRTLPP